MILILTEVEQIKNWPKTKGAPIFKKNNTTIFYTIFFPRSYFYRMWADLRNSAPQNFSPNGWKVRVPIPHLYWKIKSRFFCSSIDRWFSCFLIFKTMSGLKMYNCTCTTTMSLRTIYLQNELQAKSIQSQVIKNT